MRAVATDPVPWFSWALGTRYGAEARLAARGLSGRRVLLVEDEFLIASDLAQLLRQQGAEVLGPAATVRSALDLLQQAAAPDGAVLDVNLRGEMAFPVADALRARGVPFVFATGYTGEMIPERYAGVPCCEKPFEGPEIVRALASQHPGTTAP